MRLSREMRPRAHEPRNPPRPAPAGLRLAGDRCACSSRVCVRSSTSGTSRKESAASAFRRWGRGTWAVFSGRACGSLRREASISGASTVPRADPPLPRSGSNHFTAPPPLRLSVAAAGPVTVIRTGLPRKTGLRGPRSTHRTSSPRGGPGREGTQGLLEGGFHGCGDTQRSRAVRWNQPVKTPYGLMGRRYCDPRAFTQVPDIRANPAACGIMWQEEAHSARAGVRQYGAGRPRKPQEGIQGQHTPCLGHAQHIP